MDEATFGQREDPHHHGFKHQESSPFGLTVRGKLRKLKLHFFCLPLSGVCNWKRREIIQSTIQPLNLISFNIFVGQLKDSQEFISSTRWVHYPIGEGDFTVEEDCTFAYCCVVR